MTGLFQPTLKENTRGSVFRTLCPLLTHEENSGQVLGLWVSVYVHVACALGELLNHIN